MLATRIRTRTVLTLVTAVALVAAVAGIAAAAIPATNGTLVGCYAKKTGALRLVDPSKKCMKSEKRAGWNVKGIRGATGATGVAGAAGAVGAAGQPGPAGAVGPSDVYTDKVGNFGAIPNTNGAILTLNNLPAGSYSWTFTSDYSDGAGGGIVDCAIKVPGGATEAATTVETEAGRRTNVVMTGASTITAGNVTVECDDNSGDETFVNSRIIATKVGSVTDA